MNARLVAFARQFLKDELPRCSVESQRMFKLMHGRLYGTRSVDDATSLSIGQVVDEMKPHQLNWAMQQVERTLEKQRT